MVALTQTVLDVTSEVRPRSLSLSKKEFRVKDSNYKRGFTWKVLEVEEMSQLRCVGSGKSYRGKRRAVGA